MKNIITLTESDLYRIIKRVIKEDYSEEHLKYTHPRTGDECKIKVAKRKFDGRYGAVLTCDIYNDGNETVVAEIPVIKRSKEDVVSFICDHLEKTYEILDNMLTVSDEDFIMEGSEYGRFEIIDEPINCSFEKERETPSWEME